MHCYFDAEHLITTLYAQCGERVEFVAYSMENKTEGLSKIYINL